MAPAKPFTPTAENVKSRALASLYFSSVPRHGFHLRGKGKGILT